MPDSHRAKTNIKVGKAHPEQTEPRPKHVATIEATDAAVSVVACRRTGELVAESADQVSQRVAAESEAAQQNDIEREHDCANPNSKRPVSTRGINEP